MAVAICLAGLAGTGRAAEQAAGAKENRFSQFPSVPGPQINLIRKMPAGVWIDLGPPAPDPKWGVARGRTWAAQMPFAPSLGLAFLYGEGVHGWSSEKTGRYMDGLWAYDVMDHRWVTVVPGTDTRHPPKLILNKDGFPALPNGQPIPIAALGHAYQMTSWVPESKSFAFMEARHNFYQNALPTIGAFMKANKDLLNEHHASPWFYDTTADTWRRYRTKTESPDPYLGATLTYIPTLKGLLYIDEDRVWFYDPAQNSWKFLNPSGPKPPFGIDATSCYNSKRDRIYIGGGDYPRAKGPNAFWIYDIRKNTWIDPKPKGSPGSNRYGTHYNMMQYDSASDTVLLFRYGDDGRGIYAYSPSANEWTTVAKDLPSRWYDDYRTSGSSGFYDPELNAHFFHVAGDSDDNGTILVYRYKQARK